MMCTAFLCASICCCGICKGELELTPTNVCVTAEGGDVSLCQDGALWIADDITVKFAEDGTVTLASPTKPVYKVQIAFEGKYPNDAGIRVYHTGFSGTGGDGGWYPINTWDMVTPWYILMRRGDAEERAPDGASLCPRTDGIGVAVHPGALVTWRIAKDSLRLVLDVRAGTDPVQLGGRKLEMCRLVTRRGKMGESAFVAAREFAKLMCPKPRLPKTPVYGYNDWYCAYGENTATNFLADVACIAECAKGLSARPFMVVDDGWQTKKRMEACPSERRWAGVNSMWGMPMDEVARRVKALDAHPGLWYRPLIPEQGDGKGPVDPTDPRWKKLIREDIVRFIDWGFELLKIDYIVYDWGNKWGGPFDAEPTAPKLPSWRDRSRTTAEVVLDLYRTMREAAGDKAVIIGCNALSHFSAGLFEVQRTGGDTSGRDWLVTEKNGVNTLAMHQFLNGVFYTVDADCAGLVRRDAIDWARNRQWIDVLGRSGTAFFVSWFRDLADDEVKRTIAANFRRVAEGKCDAEPLDWVDTRTVKRWRFGSEEKTYAWRANGASVDPLADLLPKPVKIERRSGSLDALGVEKRVRVIRASVPGAPEKVTDESYVLDIADDGATITASGPRGEHWARVTLDQLKKLAGGDLPCCRIVDWPNLHWRGYMNDCGRNYLAVEGVKAMLDEMERVKMNLFHWHLADYHGWRLESKKFPQLTAKDTYVRQVGKFYTQAEFREIIAYAAARGITVMPELDVPGHSLALRRGLGVKSMAEPRVREAVAEIFAELCSLASADQMPFVHLGTDEARQLPEYCDKEYVSHWARTINRCGRRAVVWAPGIKLDKDIDFIDMAWYDNQITNSANAFFDAARMYNQSWNPCHIALMAQFLKPCRWNVDRARNLGAITCTWHDDNVGEDTLKLFRDVQVLPAIAAFGDNFWSGGREDRPEYFQWNKWCLPKYGTDDFAALVEFERRLAHHRDYVLNGVKWPFAFLKQTDISWRLTDEKGRVIDADLRGGVVNVGAIKDLQAEIVTAETVVTSRTDRVVGAWIDFTSYGSAYSRNASIGTPDVGEWNRFGAKAYVNDVEVLPPVWESPRQTSTFPTAVDNLISWGDDLCEQPLYDMGPTRRPLTPIRLKAGENRIRLVMPRPRGPWWGMFVPALGTSTHPREI